MQGRTSAGAVAVAALCLAAAACSSPAEAKPDSGSAPGDGGDGGQWVGDVGSWDDVPAGCGVEAPTACPDPHPVYADIAPIVQQRCVVCHDGTGTTWSLKEYQHLADWFDVTAAALLKCEMPPADAGFTLPAEERRAVLIWIRCGLPR